MGKREDLSSSVNSETMDLVKTGYSKPKPTPASGDKLNRQVDRAAAAARDGK